MRWALFKPETRLVFDIRVLDDPRPLPEGFWAFTTEFACIGDVIGIAPVPDHPMLRRAKVS